MRTGLGDMVLSFSSLEESLRDVIWLVVGLEGIEVRVLTHRMPFSRLVEKFRELFGLRYPKSDTDALGKFCAALRKAATDRNDLIHALWEFDRDTATAQLHKVVKDPAKVLRLNTQTVSAARVRELVNRISGLEDKLWELYFDEQPAA